MGTYLTWGMSKRLLNHVQIEQVVGTTSHNHAQISRENIEEGNCIAIQAIQSHEDGG